jgi:uncharacterized protein (TIGR02996 family)
MTVDFATAAKTNVLHSCRVSVVSELLEAIEADPNDEASQLVIADYLQAEGDPRGDLIVLDHADQRALLDDPVALDQLAWLAATYSFPRAEPEPPMLPFSRVSSGFELVYEGERYTLAQAERGRHGYIVITDAQHPRPALDALDDEDRSHSLDIELAQPWDEDQTAIILTIVSDVIRAGTPFEGLRFPFNGILSLPQYEGSPLRCYMLPIEFLRAHDATRNQLGLAARDYHRWHAIWKRLRAMQRR